jgi:NADH-quinone oxidoreductase subunit N
MSMPPYAVELCTAALLVAVLLADVIAPRSTNATGYRGGGRRAVWLVFIIGIVAILGVCLAAGGDRVLFGGSYAGDGISWLAKIIIVIGTGLAGAVSVGSVPIREKYNGACAALLLGAALGMMVLVSSRELVTMYVGLETSSISLYGLAAISKKDVFSLEAGIKYLVIGALSSGILLYGLALVYTATGSTTLDGIRSALAGQALAPLAAAGIILTLLGVGFKITMVPMHVWAPDVYQGAPTAVSAFISVVSKSAGFVFAIRMFSSAFADQRQLWETFVMAGAVLTMTVGNLAAIPQVNVKRLLAYSSISHAGYLLVGFLGNPSTGTSAVLFYLLVYTFANIAAFAAVIAFSSATGSDKLEDYAGLARRNPALALVFTFALLSLAGIPPLGGFVGKLYLFSAAMERGYLWLVVVAALNSVVSLFYYLLVLKQMYISDSPAGAVALKVSFPVKAVLLLTTVGTFWLGIIPGPVMRVFSDVSTRVFPGQ